MDYSNLCQTRLLNARELSFYFSGLYTLKTMPGLFFLFFSVRLVKFWGGAECLSFSSLYPPNQNHFLVVGWSGLWRKQNVFRFLVPVPTPNQNHFRCSWSIFAAEQNVFFFSGLYPPNPTQWSKLCTKLMCDGHCLCDFCPAQQGV